MTEQENNDWIEYRLFIMEQFKGINKSIEKLSDSREKDADKVRDEIKETVHESEQRICGRIEAMEDNQKEVIERLREAISKNSTDIVKLKIQAALWGTFAGSAVSGLIQLIMFLVETYSQTPV